MLANELEQYVKASFSGIWVQTAEPDEAQYEIVGLAKEHGWTVNVWDIAKGDVDGNGKGDPLIPLKILAESDATTTLLILHNFHKYLNNTIVLQTLINTVQAGKARRQITIVLSPLTQIPIEAEKLFVIVDHQLPSQEQLQAIAKDLTGIENEVVNSACGLTRYEAENVFALSIVKHKEIQAEEIYKQKAQILKKNNLLTLYRGADNFTNLGGLSALKDFCKKILIKQTELKPKGVLLLGVPGTGKSAISKALGNEVNRPTLLLDIGSLFGSLVGQTEQNIRQALKIADAMAPCILFLDEIEKALSGLGSNGDSGVSTRLFGTFLTWLSDHVSDVFVIATSNDISQLPPEFIRAERWDAVWFIDLPGRSDKDVIWTIYKDKYKITDEEPCGGIADAEWTGAEIQSCCRLSALMKENLKEASKFVIPVATTAKDKITNLRSWATGKCLDANNGTIYNHSAKAAKRKLA